METTLAMALNLPEVPPFPELEMMAVLEGRLPDGLEEMERRLRKDFHHAAQMIVIAGEAVNGAAHIFQQITDGFVRFPGIVLRQVAREEDDVWRSVGQRMIECADEASVGIDVLTDLLAIGEDVRVRQLQHFVGWCHLGIPDPLASGQLR